MKNELIACRNSVMHALYGVFLKPVFFKNDPETVHDSMIRFGSFLGRYRPLRTCVGGFFDYTEPRLAQTVLGITFKNPIGLAAGFDKNAELTDILPSVGFGFEEIGSVTGEPCSGNPKPRLWRLPRSKSLIVYYGLKNDGSEEISGRLQGKKFRIPVGVSVAKTNCKETVDTDAGIQDYVKAYKAFQKIGDYYTINISCPNAYGGQPFSDPTRLELLLKAISAVPRTKPIFLKMPPDISPIQIDEIIRLSEKYGIDGFICTNLTKNREIPSVKQRIIDPLPSDNGGLSGKVVQDLSDDMLKYMYKKAGKKFIIIGVGGIFSAEDAYKKIRLGATLLQMITGMIFEGPQTVSEVNRGLVRLLKRDGFSNISEAIGVDNR